MNYDRRQHPRYIPDSALLVSLGQSKRGFLKDVSESGMAFDGLLPSSGNNVIYLAFDLPDGGGAIEAVAEVVWTCEALHRTGVRFLELADASRRQLGHWISSHVFALSEKTSEEEANTAHFPVLVRSAAPPALTSPAVADLPLDVELSESVPGSALPRRERQKVRSAFQSAKNIIRIPHAPVSAGIILAILFVSAACVSLGYYLPGLTSMRGPYPGTAPLTAPVAAPVAANSGASIVDVNRVDVNRVAVNPGAATKPTIKPAINEIVASGGNAAGVLSVIPAKGAFVLQVAALARADNAAKLIGKLQRKNFPAFLPDRGKDSLYRVEVGPYEDVNYARTVEDDLKSAGFPVILRHRSAQSDSN